MRVAPGWQMRLSRVRVEDVDVLVKEQLHELGRLQELPLAAQDAGSLLGRVQHSAAQERENHHEGVLHADTERRTHAHVGRHKHTGRAESQTHTKAVNTHTLTHTPRCEAKINVLVHVFKSCDGASNQHQDITTNPLLS